MECDERLALDAQHLGPGKECSHTWKQCVFNMGKSQQLQKPWKDPKCTLLHRRALVLKTGVHKRHDV